MFGSKDNFHGLAIFLDTYPNDETTEVCLYFLPQAGQEELGWGWVGVWRVGWGPGLLPGLGTEGASRDWGPYCLPQAGLAME